MRVFSVLVFLSNVNKSCRRVNERQLTRESLYESFLNSNVWIEREQELIRVEEQCFYKRFLY